ncbi:DUF3822 family protein [Psychroflexus montanilacus]|uniref:DUF3822 family protein n=1 Tax=Psychroflexus montanilacus TaxID=2873598 RepID=UPI001CCCC884|nr:DUF3822 family protein [Psychroflexus montanilacus]MBZ9651779.1 DUF3822 family protein [Psychroflexus montanilacus]
MSENFSYKTNRLSIFILQDGFSFLVKNENSTPLAFENFKLGKSASASELLKLLRSKIHTEFIQREEVRDLEVLYGNPQFTVIPQEYFDESQLPHYLKYNSKLIEGDDFSFDEISSIQANTVYIPYVNINNYLFEVFGSFEFTHVLTGLINKGFKKSQDIDEYIYVHVSHQMIYFTAFKNQKMLLSNAFSFETAEDFAYYILFTIEELKFDRENMTIGFSGKFFNTEKNTALTILSTYLRHISFLNEIAPESLENQEGFQEHFNLL